MEKQIRRYKEKHSSHKVVNINKLATFDLDFNDGAAVRLNQVSNKPIDKIEAYLQLKVDNADFILFKQGISAVDSDLDYSNKNYAVMYRQNDLYKLLEIPFEKIKDHSLDNASFVEYELNIVSDSLSNPNIEFNKISECNVKELNISEAIEEIEKNKAAFMPFFNIESQYFNVVFNNGKEYEVLVPAY